MRRNTCLVLIFCTGLISFSMLSCRTLTGLGPRKAQQEAESLRHEIKSLKNEIQTLRSKSIESRANDTILAIKDKDTKKLSTFVHPEKGVRFSPYAHVDIENDRVFTTVQIHNIFADQTRYLWGRYDGSGEPIESTFEEYYKKFIYDQDFANAEKVSYNRIIGSGNTENNSFEVYLDGMIVEYHFSGFHPQYGGMDWKSLRLVFERKDGVWYLIGVIHDEWTI